MTDDVIGLSWDAPEFYDTGKPLDVMRDIKTMTISRKQESSTDHRWDFSLSRDGWSAVGQTLPIKWTQGNLRAASQSEIAFIVSPENLTLPAEQYRYVSLNLWTKHAERAYIAFLTSDNNTWDITPDVPFQSAVHTSLLSYRRAFEARKLKALPLIPQRSKTDGNILALFRGLLRRQILRFNPYWALFTKYFPTFGDFLENVSGFSPSESARTREYLVDMKEVAGWTGTIQQIGVLAYTATPETGNLELGLDDFTLLDTPSPPVSLYESPPWGFWHDEEGWRAGSQNTVIGSAGGALFLENSRGPILAMSAPGLRIPGDSLRDIQIRMQAAEEKQVYVLLRSAEDSAFEKWSAQELTTPSPTVFPLTLQAAESFQVVTIACPERSDDAGEVSQIGLYFPGNQQIPILIDYIAPSQSERVTEALTPLLLQKSLPSPSDMRRQVRQQLVNRNPRFDMAYETLDSDTETFNDETVTLVDASPRDPAPIVLREDGSFAFDDTGTIYDDESEALPFKRGERYTYTVELTDRRGQSSVLPAALNVTVPFIPSAPVSVTAAASDGEVELSWHRTFLDVNGEKIRAFDGYHIYRTTTTWHENLFTIQTAKRLILSLWERLKTGRLFTPCSTAVSGQYGEVPLYKAAMNDTGFVDTAVVNGTTYYYVVQAVTSVTNSMVVGETSLEVSATPADTEAPPAPTDLTSAYLADTVKLFWNFSAAPDWKGFNVYRGASADGPFQQINAKLVSQPAYDDASAAPNQQYFYYISSIDTAEPPNESQASNIVQVTTKKR